MGIDEGKMKQKIKEDENLFPLCVCVEVGGDCSAFGLWETLFFQVV